MKREEFAKKLGVLLDVLTNSNNEDLMIHGSDKTEGGMDFFVAKASCTAITCGSGLVTMW